MKFLYADSLDYVDSKFDFIEDSSAEDRKPYWDDSFTHEMHNEVPYSGMLISRSIVGDPIKTGKYTQAQSMYFRRVGARKFLRLEKKKYSKLWIMGDCGAFNYHKMKVPPYTPKDTVEFYNDGQFTHGCAVDHIIFDFDTQEVPLKHVTQDNRDRFNITLQYAQEFFTETKKSKATFIPVGVIQGWSPKSMAKSAQSLIKMGYSFLALGGMAPLSTDKIEHALTEVKEVLPTNKVVHLHLLGYGKITELERLKRFNIGSLDTSSPMVRSFTDSKRNYIYPSTKKELEWYTALRIPQSLENLNLKNLVKEGLVKQETLTRLEHKSLISIRNFDIGKAEVDNVINDILEYSKFLYEYKKGKYTRKNAMKSLLENYKKTLESKIWKKCSCNICSNAGIEVMIFRGSNRNKRRGMHNCYHFHKYLKAIHRT